MKNSIGSEKSHLPDCICSVAASAGVIMAAAENFGKSGLSVLAASL